MKRFSDIKKRIRKRGLVYNVTKRGLKLDVDSLINNKLVKDKLRSI